MEIPRVKFQGARSTAGRLLTMDGWMCWGVRNVESLSLTTAALVSSSLIGRHVALLPPKSPGCGENMD